MIKRHKFNFEFIIKLTLFLIIVLPLTYVLFFKPLISKMSVNCPENLIPERILLEHPIVQDNSFESHVNNYSLNGICTKTLIGECGISLSKWKDNTTMNEPRCSAGNSEGQNINYFYCNPIIYQKTSISSEGIVQKPIDLLIYLIVDPSDKNEEGYLIKEYKCVNR